MLELNAGENLERAVADKLAALIPYILDLEELLVAEVNEGLILMITSVTAVDTLVAVIEQAEFNARVYRLWILGDILDEERDVAGGGGVAQAFRVQIQHPACVLIGKDGTGEQAVDLLRMRVKVVSEFLHAPDVVDQMVHGFRRWRDTTGHGPTSRR